MISKSEFKDNLDLKVGDEVDVYVENKENKKGQLILSRKKAENRTNQASDRTQWSIQSSYRISLIKQFITNQLRRINLRVTDTV